MMKNLKLLGTLSKNFVFAVQSQIFRGQNSNSRVSEPEKVEFFQFLPKYGLQYTKWKLWAVQITLCNNIWGFSSQNFENSSIYLWFSHILRVQISPHGNSQMVKINNFDRTDVQGTSKDAFWHARLRPKIIQAQVFMKILKNIHFG